MSVRTYQEGDNTFIEADFGVNKNFSASCPTRLFNIDTVSYMLRSLSDVIYQHRTTNSKPRV